MYLPAKTLLSQFEFASSLLVLRGQSSDIRVPVNAHLFVTFNTSTGALLCVNLNTLVRLVQAHRLIVTEALALVLQRDHEIAWRLVGTALDVLLAREGQLPVDLIDELVSLLREAVLAELPRVVRSIRAKPLMVHTESLRRPERVLDRLLERVSTPYRKLARL